MHGFNFPSLFVYHFLPNEFWLNQFKTPLWLKLAMFGGSLLSVTGLILMKMKPAETQFRQNFFPFCVLFYVIHLLVTLILDVQFSAGPVRWAFGCFFAFAFLWCCGIDLLARRWLRERSKYVVLGVTLLFCTSANLYLLLTQAPHLNSFSLHP